MPSKSKPLKKLLHFYWEICTKTNPDGKLKQEMILVCNAIRNDLQHPNEYIRGATLRFLCKLQEPELIEPLLPTVRQCLEHRHSYVRKNAVFAIYSIYILADHLIPDAPELVLSFLAAENDTICKRNAFVVLSNINHDQAVQYILENYDAIPSMDQSLQSAIIEFIRTDALSPSEHKPKYLRLLYDLLDSTSNAIAYDAASSLATLTTSVNVITAAASKFIDLSIKEPDNNIKLIVLDRVDQLRKKYPGTLEDLTMEILRVLSSPDIDVRKKALAIVLEMVSGKNVEEVVLLLKKELTRTMEVDYEQNNEYRQLLIHAIHTCAIKHPEVASSVAHLLLEVIGEFNKATAVDVISFIKEVIERHPDLRSSILDKLSSTFGDFQEDKVLRGALWIMGEYSLTPQNIRDAWQRIRNSLGEIPILSSEKHAGEKIDADGQDAENVNFTASASGRRILPDGTYASESAFIQIEAGTAPKSSAERKLPPLRALIIGGDFFTASVLASTITKLVMRFDSIGGDAKFANALRAEAMLIMSSIIRVGQSTYVQGAIDEDSVDRIMTCFNSLTEFSVETGLQPVFLDDTKKAFSAILKAEDKARASINAAEKAKNAIQPDDLLNIRQLDARPDTSGVDEFALDLNKATEGGEIDVDPITSNLNRIVQLTGFSDSVYVEAYVKINKFDIILDVLLVNQTDETLQNLSVEFATLGDLKLVERPVIQSVGPRSFLSVQATVKVSSAETGVIFGNVIYDGASTAEANIVILSDIQVNLLDYIKPASCPENTFRSLWTEYEWENTIKVDSKLPTPKAYLDKIMADLHMECLTPLASIVENCGFLSANLYSKSVFGEDALANLSVELSPEGRVVGHLRVRTKGQGERLVL